MYIVMKAAAHMPARCWGQYRRVAVVEVSAGYDEEHPPMMISSRARGVVRVVRTWERCCFGRRGTPRSAYGRAVREAEELAAQLNASA